MRRQGDSTSRPPQGSPHFAAREFACPHCGLVKVTSELLMVLEKIRECHGDRPVRIVSGYRCPIHNANVGGATHSQHMLGKAADIPPATCTPAVARACGARGIGVAGNWAVHVDVRSGGMAEWRYS